MSEPLAYLESLPLRDYYKTQHWKDRREAFRDVRPQQCELCFLTPERINVYDWDFPLVVHHLSYFWLGREPDQDLMLVCIPCHNLIHHPDSPQARRWVEYNVSDNSLEHRAYEVNPNTIRNRDLG